MDSNRVWNPVPLHTQMIERNNMSIYALAKALGMTYGHVWSVVQGVRKPGYEMLEALANYGFDVNLLLVGESNDVSAHTANA